METLEGKDVPAPGEVAGLLGSARAVFGRLAEADMTALTVQEQFEVLATLEKLDAVRAAIRAQASAVFETMGGPDQYGFGTLSTCVQAQFKITKGKARTYKKAARQYRGHPLIIDAMNGELISESWAGDFMTWSEALKDPELTAKMDDILLAGALAGLDHPDLRGLYEEVRALTAPPDQDGKEPPDRGLDLVTTLDGAGILRGDLTPEAAALLKAGLDAYAAHRSGTDDDRTYSQRAHDALVQLLKLALRSGDVPQSGGQDTTAIVHLPLHDLRTTEGASAVEDQWGRQMHAAWTGQLAAAHAKGGRDTWLYGDDARAIACDAMIAPVVTGQLQPGVFTRIIEVSAELHQLISQQQDQDSQDAHSTAGHGTAGHGTDGHGTDGHGTDGTGTGTGGDRERDGRLALIDLEAAAARDARVLELFLTLTGLVADAVSGPGGLASALRTSLFAGSALGTASLPLDLGDTDRVKPHIRRALNLRHPVCARHGCGQPASRCEAHHVIPRSQHGPTSLNNCANLCWYHHHIAVHKLGWAVTVNNAGIVTVRRPDGTIENPAHAP